MQYIELRDGFSVRKDAIEAIERKDELTSIVKTNFNSYESVFPYDVLLQLLEREELPTQTETQTLNILKEIGTPAH